MLYKNKACFKCLPWLFENVGSGYKAVARQSGGGDFPLEHQRHRLAQLVVEEPQSVALFDVRVEGGAVTALNQVALVLVRLRVRAPNLCKKHFYEKIDLLVDREAVVSPRPHLQ